jgi:hypothetical protein
MRADLTVTTPTTTTQLDVLAPDVLGSSTTENITGTFSGRFVSVKVNAELGL